MEVGGGVPPAVQASLRGLRSSASAALSVSPPPATSDSVKPLEKVQKKKAIKSECSNAISPALSGNGEAGWEIGLRNPRRPRR